MKVALIQQSCQHHQADNEAAIQQAKAVGAELVVLSELHRHPYFCQTENAEYFELAQAIPGLYTQWLSSLAKKLQLVIVGSLFERRAAGIYHNTAVVLDSDGSLAGRYRKMHIPDDPGFYEKFYFTPGDALGKYMGFNPIQTSLGKLGILICWDQWFPEAARLMALAGAEILIYPTAIGWNPGDDYAEQQRQLDAWVTIQRSHAIANALPVISCNRYGFEPDSSHATQGIQFWGNSFITGSQGEIFTQADNEQAEILCSEIDLQATESTRRIWPYLRDRRIDAYTGLKARYLS
ncbi:carbon-nitrogen hydrolase [Candidatus Venteria ishoeyi]|uniref:N-carbamoyl-D-amino acid hydrolase n=1 Tax=Candidatus Venteria ishoeyi TaxID=1899563 RepID=A0A1H6FAI8_9GAMM|nr:carbon-nitrogen hydrolase [Candidatus Venteria ishoeyi]SEH06156.1 N-carbamoyl-D-amino acid hydrolase [Candidatus Venteria ishoeyi]